MFAHLGVPLKSQGRSQAEVSSNIERIRSISIPTLVIHAEYDFIVPFEQGNALYENSAAADKSLLIIPNATHNDIFLVGRDEYFGAVAEFIKAHG